MTIYVILLIPVCFIENEFLVIIYETSRIYLMATFCESQRVAAGPWDKHKPLYRTLLRKASMVPPHRLILIG